MIRFLFSSFGILLLSSFLTGCSNDSDVERDAPLVVGTFVGLSEQSPSSRVFMEHAVKGGGKYFFESGDRLWAKSNDGRVFSGVLSNQSASSANASFKIAITQGTTRCDVYYVGKNDSFDKVVIAARQRQSSANSTRHFSASGDCASGVAVLRNNVYEFSLHHKTSFLCFVPYSDNAGSEWVLDSIGVSSSQNLCGVYSFGKGVLSSEPLSGGSNSLTIVCGDNGFSLNTTSYNASVNGTYAVIAPGVHRFSVRYFTRNVNSGEHKTFVRNFTTEQTCRPNGITDIASRLRF